MFIYNKYFRYLDKFIFKDYFIKKKNFEISILQNLHVAKKNNFLNNLDLLDDLILKIKRNNKLKIVQLNEIVSSCSKNTNLLSFRVDIDAGIWSLKKMAKIFNKHKIICPFYILAGSYYYGSKCNQNFFEKNDFFFNNYLDVIKNENQLIGIHNNILDFYISGLDGLEILKSEINFLNKKKYNIKSSSSHNSAWYYGAENFQIFEDFINKDINKGFFTNKNIRLGLIKMSSLGLDFEANFPTLVNKKNLKYFSYKTSDPIRDVIWLKNHFINNPIYESAYDTDIWLVGKNNFFIADRIRKTINLDCTFDKILDYLDTYNNNKIIFNLHPEYFY